ncbi:MAG: RagB/SusD family nutrient uptake outer membrane protein [Bacteroidetes bacterium]|nr:RagB/SusD family nutrient uptake outer membrane protein [Bacteroidota bacterium]
MKNILKITTVLAGLLLMLNSCMKDLDTIPLDKDVTTAATVYDDPAAYKQVLAKLYAGLAVSGQQGPAGNGDISGIDEGFGQYLRGLWYMQELTTDEAVIAWNDQTIKDLHWQTWGTSDVFISAFYYRVFYQISICNEYIRETSDAKLDERGVSGSLRTDVEHFRAEARFLRALSYWHALDHFGNVPFVTEEDAVGAFFPEQISRADLFSYIESELKAIEPLMVEARANEYGRADKGAVWTLLAKLYLNAEVYAGVNKYADCISYCEKVINAGYSLVDDYQQLFLADNDMLPEVIFSVNFDGNRTQTYGGTNFIIHAAVGGDMDPNEFGVGGGWGGTRATSAFVDLFPDETGEADGRAMFHTEGQTKEIVDIGDFTNGYAITKWKNINSDGTTGSNVDFPDTDFPMFRLADVYLMYAEAVLRGGGGNTGTAVDYVNMIRQRSNAATVSSIDLDFILEERGRELYWECHRRTDLIRFGEFTGGDYIWPWKGNVPDGKVTDDKYNLFPIPASDIGANPNLTQNTGY